MATYISTRNVIVGEKDGYVDFVITLDAPSQDQVSVRYATSYLSASSGASNDYIHTDGNLVFAPGTTTQTVRVPLVDDLVSETLESFELVLSNAVNAVIATPSATATIVDNDTIASTSSPANLSVRDVVVDASAGSATFAVVLDKAVGAGFSVAYGTFDGNARAGSDYVAASGTLAFGAGDTVKHVTVALPKDAAAAPDEIFSLVLGAVSGAGGSQVVVADGIGQALVGAHGQTPKALPTVSVNNPHVGEGDGYVDFTISLDAPSEREVSLSFSTDYETAFSGTSRDYLHTNGKLVFAPGTTTQTVRVALSNDLTAESLETFALQLSNVSNAVVANNRGIATIVDNDTIADGANPASLSVRDVVVDASAGTATFAVLLDKALGRSFSVDYATVDGNARAGSDYLAASGSLTFGAGETVKNVTVVLPRDGAAEPDEMFSLVLGALSGPAGSQVRVTDGIGQATIGAHGQTFKAMPTITVNNPIVGESAGYVDFVVSLDAPSERQVSVYYGTDYLTAFSGNSQDYIHAGGTLVFAPGVTTQTVRVSLPDDLVAEALESFELNLTGPINAVIAHNHGVATIVDNDTIADSANPAGLSVRDVVVDASAGSATFAVVLDKAVGASFSVAYGTANGSAQAGSDYLAAAGTLTFGPGETAKNVTVALPRDGAAEAAESFSLVLGALSGAGANAVTLARSSGHATIGAHGPATGGQPVISVGDIVVGEKDGYAQFVVTLDAASTSQVTVHYTTDQGTAASGSPGDYSHVGGTLVFAPGVTTQTVRVAIVSDNLNEAHESFSLRLMAATNATIGQTSATATIVDGSSYHHVKGGAGIDTVNYAGNRDAYTIDRVADGFTISHKNGVGGTDLLTGIERIDFGDVNMALDIDGIGGQAYRIYQAALNRTPDSAGLGFWIDVMDRGLSLAEVAAGFMRTPEFIAAYGANPSNHDLVSQIYLNVLHRPAEPGGLEYWTGALDRGVVTAAQALSMISESPENQAALAPVIGEGFTYTPYG
ncbi:Calx-beta domain-containing protein [Telluria beijingensis]|uniref:Calx-beta domain-containing protein n=1 Tax=Telluria beijingensis TaxID=3068633 RepID=UPI0027956719|nr:Calx-beta domain-containing protein [Massilia sp. REN29]